MTARCPTAGGSGAWPYPHFSYHFSRKIETQIKRFLAEPWPSRLQPRVGPLLVLQTLPFDRYYEGLIELIFQRPNLCEPYLSKQLL